MKVIRNTDKWNFKFHAFCASALSEVTVAVLTALIHPKVMVFFASVLNAKVTGAVTFDIPPTLYSKHGRRCFIGISKYRGELKVRRAAE